ncbi:MAG TPA: metallophosphoesterase [Bacillota bacterium]|nr:metallophosphoesterase [Bacillota bacterium]
MKKRSLLALILVLFTIISLTSISPIYSQNTGYYRLVVLADLHWPSKVKKTAKKVGKKGINSVKTDKIIAAKTRAVEEINRWDDVDEVVLLGDIVAQTGSESEYTATRQFVSRINKPVVYLPGNHDYLYRDSLAKKKLVRANRETQSLKLERFRQTFGQDFLYFSKRVGSCLLIYLATDKLETKFSAEISQQQLDWLRKQLGANSKVPTIIFFHAPLANTLKEQKSEAKESKRFAQPVQQIDALLKDNPQVFMWVSGHTHTRATNPGFKSVLNYYQGRVLNVHNSSLDQKTIWTNSYYLHPDKVVIRTYNHQTKQWVNELEREVLLPRL